MSDACSNGDMPYAARPCGECPWRVDAIPGKFPPERYDQLRATAGGPGAEVGFDAPIFACHMSHEGKDRACAGWLAVVGFEHLGVRFALIQGRLPGDALEPKPGWPELYSSYEDLAEANGE